MAKKHHSVAMSRPKPIFLRPPAPVVIRKTVHVAKTKKHKGHRGHGRSKGMLGLTQHQINAGLGGAALGFISKQFPNLPTIPILGRNGSIALGAYLLRGKLPLADDIATAAIVVSMFQLGSEGKIGGDEENVDGYVA